MKLIDSTAKTNWKFLAIVAVLVLLAAGGILLLKTLQPSPISPADKQSTIETSSWQTYRNEEFGFEFQYPTDWFVENISATSASPFHLVIDPSPINRNIVDAPISAIKIHLNRCWKQLEKYPCQNTVSEAVAYRRSFINEETLKEKAIHISGKDGVQMSGINKNDQSLAVFYTNVAIVPWDNDDQLMIELNKSEFEDVFDQILSTFRFVE